jgi:hypothetical protein
MNTNDMRKLAAMGVEMRTERVGPVAVTCIADNMQAVEAVYAEWLRRNVGREAVVKDGLVDQQTGQCGDARGVILSGRVIRREGRKPLFAVTLRLPAGTEVECKSPNHKDIVR